MRRVPRSDNIFARPFMRRVPRSDNILRLSALLLLYKGGIIARATPSNDRHQKTFAFSTNVFRLLRLFNDARSALDDLHLADMILAIIANHLADEGIGILRERDA